MNPAGNGIEASPANAHVTTAPSDFGKKGRKQINFVRLYVSDPSLAAPWTVTVTVDEVTRPAGGAVWGAVAGGVCGRAACANAVGAATAATRPSPTRMPASRGEINRDRIGERSFR